MIGELTTQEKLAMTVDAIRNLRAQLFTLQLQGIANQASFKEDHELGKRHNEREKALHAAISQLESKHFALIAEQSNPSNQSSPPDVLAQS